MFDTQIGFGSDKILLNPGPVTTSWEVRKESLKYNCHREKDFCDMIGNIRNDLVKLVEGGNEYTSVLFASSGTGAIESTIGSTISMKPEINDEKLLIISNGAYGQRMEKISRLLKIPCVNLAYKWGEKIDLDKVKHTIESGIFSHVLTVHHETTTGILNPIREIGKIANNHNCVYIVDAISSIGGIPINIKQCHVDFLIGVANKCIQGIPGVSYVICNKNELELLTENSRSLYFDLYTEYQSQKSNIMRFTAPVQTMFAFNQAMKELKEETVEGRYQRYSQNYDTLLKGFSEMGFKLYPTATPSKLLATFYSQGDFDRFHDALYQEGYVIYPGKLSDEDTFRIAVMGNINSETIKEFLKVCWKAL